MGTWGPAIKSNDTSSDIYADFFDLYNEGLGPTEISERLIQENQDLINSSDDGNNFWFALALSLWETKSLDQKIYNKVKYLVESGNDLAVWRELDVDESEIRKRKIALGKFFDKISNEKSRPKARKKKKLKQPIYGKGTCLTFILDNGNYGGAIVLAADNTTTYGYNLIVSTRLNQPNQPTTTEFTKSDVLIANFGSWENKLTVTWYLPDKFEKCYSDLFQVMGYVSVDREYIPNRTEFQANFSGSWHYIIEPINKQFEYEIAHGITRSFPVKDLIKQKKWWKF